MEAAGGTAAAEVPARFREASGLPGVRSLGRRMLGDAGSLYGLAVRGRRMATTTALRVRDQAELIHWFCHRFCVVHGIELELRGELPRRPSLIVANHVSYIDPMTLPALFPCIPVAKGEISSWPFIGSAARTVGLLWVRRGDPYSGARVIRRAMKVLGHGVSVLNFPEGTTTAGDRVLEFSHGLFGAAVHTGVPVVPIHFALGARELCWIDDETFVPHYVHLSRRPRVLVRVSVCDALDPADYPSARALAAAARARITAIAGLADEAPGRPGTIRVARTGSLN